MTVSLGPPEALCLASLRSPLTAAAPVPCRCPLTSRRPLPGLAPVGPLRYPPHAGPNGSGLCGRATRQGITRPTVCRWHLGPSVHAGGRGHPPPPSVTRVHASKNATVPHAGAR